MNSTVRAPSLVTLNSECFYSVYTYRVLLAAVALQQLQALVLARDVLVERRHVLRQHAQLLLVVARRRLQLLLLHAPNNVYLILFFLMPKRDKLKLFKK